MSVIYVREQGAYIKKIDKRIVIEKGGKILADIPLRSVTNLSVIGNVQVTTQVLQLMMQEGIDVSFFTYSGKHIGQIAAESSKNIFLRFSQYKRYENIDDRLKIARVIVANKIQNQIAVLSEFNWKGIEHDYHAETGQLKKQLTALESASTANEVMGVEGICSAIYFTGFSFMFKCKFRFEKRTRRPPKDPINIILSLAYTLLTKEVAAALEAESFETYLGFLHGIRYGRKSLSLDIVEEFRQPVVDRLIVILFNKNMLGEFDFEQREEEIALTEDGFRKFCVEYEKWMKKPVDKVESRSFRTIIRDQVSELKRAIRNNEMYKPYEWRCQHVSDQL